MKNGGEASQAGALRLAVSLALQSFVDAETQDKLRLGKWSYTTNCIPCFGTDQNLSLGLEEFTGTVGQILIPTPITFMNLASKT